MDLQELKVYVIALIFFFSLPFSFFIVKEYQDYKLYQKSQFTLFLEQTNSSSNPDILKVREEIQQYLEQ